MNRAERRRSGRANGHWTEAPQPRFTLIPFDKITTASEPPFLVKGLIPRVGLTVLYGPPKCGKSFWIADLMMHVALGWPYRGKRVQAGPVVYCAFEGEHGFGARVEAWRRDRLVGYGDLHVPFYLIATRMALVKDHGDLIASIRAALGEDQPVAIVFDTVRRSLTGSESDDEAMGLYIDAADAIRETFGCAVILVHHSGLEAGRPRGSTSLPGAADAQLVCTKDESGVVTVEVQLMKDGPEGECVASRLRQVEVGTDEDADPITSLVVEEIEGEQRPAKPDKRARMPKAARVALDALREAVDAVGKEPPTGVAEIPSSARKTVSRAQWRDHAKARGVSTSDRESAVRMALDRASTYLVAERHIGVWEDHVWPV